ncbi:476_t:CDS:2, partial [Acaulospora morrowiae]
RKWEQVEVNEVFITNKPKLESVLILNRLWFQENVMKLDFPNKTLTLLNGISCKNIKEKKLQDQESLTILPEEERPQDLNSDAHSRNSISSEASANSDGSKLPPKGKICSEANSKCKKSLGKLKRELFTPELSSQEPSIEQYHATEISETLCPGKVTSGDNSSIDKASQHLAQLCDKAFDAEDRANRANQKEILCWSLYSKDFRIQLNEIIENSGGKIGEKKARGLLYDSITEQLNLLRKQISQEL